MEKNLKNSKGITLIALVVTIIVLLILAGISIMMLSGDNGILHQTTNARTKTIHANVLEQMQLEASAYTVDKTTGNYSNSLIDYLESKSIISDISGEEDKWLINVTTLLGANQSMGIGTYPNDVYVLEKKDTSTGSIVNTKVATTTPVKIAATSSQTTYKVVYYGNTENTNITLGSLLDTDKYNSDNLNPAKEYGYENKEGVVDASTLQEGDIINYYYDKTKAPIECVVLYDSNSENGLQVISLDSVRDVILGYNGTNQDSKVVEAFKNGAPSGYEGEDTAFQKARWSYNYALQTLNGYARDYLGDMATSARCVGSPSNDIVLSEDETTNMFTADESYEYFSSYNGKLKNNDNNTTGTYSVSYSISNISEDLKKLDTLGIVKTPSSKGYWLASRYVEDIYSYKKLNFNVRRVSNNGYLESCHLCSVDEIGAHPWEDDNLLGFRPIFNLKSNIKIQKTGHQDFGKGGFSQPTPVY